MKKFLSLLLALLILLSCTAALSENEILYTATATVGLKVRAQADSSSKGVGKISKGETVMIVEIGDEWCYVYDGRNYGYVATKYLENIKDVAGAPGGEDPGTEVNLAALNGEEAAPGFTMTEATYEDKFVCSTLYLVSVYEEPDTSSKVLTKLKKYTEIHVGENSGGWSLIRYNEDHYGYAITEKLFKWDRIDPYAGEIPGQDLCTKIVWLGQSTHIYNATTNEDDKTLNPGSVIAVYDSDGNGHYLFPYERWTDYINESETVYSMDVVPWDEAESGDLIAAMTTYFAVGIHTMEYQGRNWNVHLGAHYITGTVLQPGEEYFSNNVMGPYTKATGYHEAPINSPNASTGFGGGCCQVNTTFYITSIQLPLYIKHRQVHQNIGMHYCKIGFDASVGDGENGLRLINTLPYAIRYQYMVSDGVLTCCIFRN